MEAVCGYCVASWTILQDQSHGTNRRWYYRGLVLQRGYSDHRSRITLDCWLDGVGCPTIGRIFEAARFKLEMEASKGTCYCSTLADTPSLKDTNKALEGDYCSLKAADESKNWRREGKPASAVLVGCWTGLRPLGDMPHNAAPTRW